MASKVMVDGCVIHGGCVVCGVIIKRNRLTISGSGSVGMVLVRSRLASHVTRRSSVVVSFGLLFALSSGGNDSNECKSKRSHIDFRRL